jgi:GNAT superfamily N-acetyltransferase
MVTRMQTLRACGEADIPVILEIVNAAAEAYRGVIPADCFHDPYMGADELQREIRAGVSFLGCEIDGKLLGVMGLQPVQDVDLIRHAYVRPDTQGKGVGAALIAELMRGSARPMLVGTWSDARWAIRFYERHGFALANAERAEALLQKYWSIPARQTAMSVVLSRGFTYR